VPPLHLRNRKYFEEEGPLNAMLSFDIKTWLADNLMMKADKIAMAHSLEGRFPFLDLDFLQFCGGLPEQAKLHSDGTSKWLLRRLMHKRLPPQILERKKMGFSVPLADFVKEARERVMSCLSDKNLDSLWFHVDRERVAGLIEGYYKGQHADTLRTWTVIVMLLWARTNSQGGS
jgi:asparagine synthase (glutamine-hydrolysing)